jgi:hypothetical protein
MRNRNARALSERNAHGILTARSVDAQTLRAAIGVATDRLVAVRRVETVAAERWFKEVEHRSTLQRRRDARLHGSGLRRGFATSFVDGGGGVFYCVRRLLDLPLGESVSDGCIDEGCADRNFARVDATRLV